jgi:hypothetical protein
MFIDANDYIDITVYYKKTGAHYVAYNQKDFEKKVATDEAKKKFSSVAVKMRTLTWGLYNNINEAAVIKTNNSDRDWNYRLYKENKLKSVIMGWDAKRKNEKGELVPVPVNNETITSMAPEIAEIILSEYDTVMSLDDEEVVPVK